MPTKIKKTAKKTKPTARKPARRREKAIKAYHLLPADGRLGYEDNREVVVGETLEVDVEPELCAAGLHASVRCLDTLRYSPGENPRLCLVEVSGDVKVGEDKICGRRRKVTAMLTSEATSKIMQEFACRAAEMALEVVEGKGGGAAAVAAVAAGRKAVEMARRYRRGDCTEAELVAARDAARAAWYAARAAGHAARVAREAARTARTEGRT